MKINGFNLMEDMMVTVVDSVHTDHEKRDDNGIKMPLGELEGNIIYRVLTRGPRGRAIICSNLRANEIYDFLKNEGYTGGEIYVQKRRILG